MSISCSCDLEPTDGSWWFYGYNTIKPLPNKRSCRCDSCKSMIRPGDNCIIEPRYRFPISEIEERIHGDEVSIRPLRYCEECSDIYLLISSMDACCNWDKDLWNQLQKHIEIGGCHDDGSTEQTVLEKFSEWLFSGMEAPNEPVCK